MNLRTHLSNPAHFPLRALRRLAGAAISLPPLLASFLSSFLSIASLASLLLSSLLVLPALVTASAQAAPPAPFRTSYDAFYGDFKALATRSLGRDAISGRFVLNSQLELAILGSVIASINERSEFLWDDEQPLPLEYEYVQAGFGARERSIHFDHEAGKAEYTINDKTGTLDLQGPAFDELSGYLLLEEQLRAGKTDISFDVVDRDELKNVRYKVQGTEVLNTRLGEINAIRIERVRDEDSSRQTEMWLAPGHNYMMVKLVQKEPNGRVIRLEIREATYDGKPVTAGQLATVP